MSQNKIQFQEGKKCIYWDVPVREKGVQRKILGWIPISY